MASQPSTATPPTKRAAVPWHVITRIAAAVPADAKTVRKVVLGQPVRGGVYDRICAALRAEGIAFPAPAEGAVELPGSADET